MKSYRNIDEVLADRRKDVALHEMIDSLLTTPYVWQIHGLTPFSIIPQLYETDFVDMSTPNWWALPVELQIELGKGYQQWYAHRLGLVEPEHTFTDGAEIKMRLIPPMRYLMGPDRQVVLVKKPFWMGNCEVTQEQWLSVMGDNPSRFQGYTNRPVERVSWHECQEFCKRTHTKLPTEEKWKLACRAGTTTRYSFGDDPELLKKYGWFWDNSSRRTHSVGELEANAFGLYDMHGNVWEWCQNEDRFSGLERVLCGGGCFDGATSCTSEIRIWRNSAFYDGDFGFRVVRSFYP